MPSVGALGQAMRTPADLDTSRHLLDSWGARHHPTPTKDWDLALFQARLLDLVPPDGRILDAGCASSPLLVNLAAAGHRDLWGIDFHLGDLTGLRHPAVTYLQGNLMHSPFPDASFDAVTCLSVIEHGCDPPAFFDEMARLLRPGGTLLVSTDYWPRRKATWFVRRKFTFGLPWRIFSASDVGQMREQAEAAGLQAPGEWDLVAGERMVSWNGRRYTFFAFEVRKA